MDKGALVRVTLTVKQWERVLSALSSHDPTVRLLIVAQMQQAADEKHRTPMVPPWEPNQ